MFINWMCLDVTCCPFFSISNDLINSRNIKPLVAESIHIKSFNTLNWYGCVVSPDLDQFHDESISISIDSTRSVTMTNHSLVVGYAVQSFSSEQIFFIFWYIFYKKNHSRPATPSDTSGTYIKSLEYHCLFFVFLFPETNQMQIDSFCWSVCSRTFDFRMSSSLPKAHNAYLYPHNTHLNSIEYITSLIIYKLTVIES